MSITAERKKSSREESKKYWEWSKDIWKAASPKFQKPSPAPGFDAEGMRSEWFPHWAPESYDGDSKLKRWKEFASEAVFPQSSKPKNWWPELTRFEEVLARGHGAPGFDGWAASEVKMLLKFARWLIEELFGLWKKVTEYAIMNRGRLNTEEAKELLEACVPWRMVGIPKKDENESRPIGVGSYLLRSWLSTLAGSLPEVDEDQWACRKLTSVVHATCSWLAADCDEGAETDLSRAYDNIDHGIAAASFEAGGVPEAATAMCCFAWAGPRICCVESELAEPIWPKKALPQGDSCAPAGMTSVLIPWKPAPARGWKFMDDRSLAAKGKGCKGEGGARTTTNPGVRSSNRFC